MAFIDGLRQIINVERNNPLNRANLTTLLDSAFKTTDFDGVRFFTPFSTTQNFGWNDSNLPAFLDAVQFVITNYRRKVWLDLTDVQNKGDETGAGETATEAHIASAAAQIAARNIDPEFLLVGAANEWTDNNDIANAARLARWKIIRAALPNHYQSWAGGYWDYYKTAEQQNMLPPPDKLAVAMFHSYESHSAADWKTILTGVKTLIDGWGVPGFWAEFGPESSYSNLDVAANMTQYQNDWYNFCVAAGPLGIGVGPWAGTDQGGFRLNVTGGWTLRDAVISSANWNKTAYKTPGVAALYGAPSAPVTPPVVVTGSGSSSGSSSSASTTSAGSSSAGTSVGSSSALTSAGTSSVSSGASSGTSSGSGVPTVKPLVVVVSFTVTQMVLAITKATGRLDTVELTIDDKYIGVLRDEMVDRSFDYQMDLPAAGSHVVSVELRGSGITVSQTVTVPGTSSGGSTGTSSGSGSAASSSGASSGSSSSSSSAPAGSSSGSSSGAPGILDQILSALQSAPAATITAIKNVFTGG